MKNNAIKINARVNHKAFGDGTVIQQNDRYITVLFDDGETKRFMNESFLTMGFFVMKDNYYDNIRIKRVIVENLFDNQTNYDININVINDVSILTAPNGCGKTTIFKFLDFIFNPKFKTFLAIKDIPFKKFTCVLDNGYELELYREDLESSNNERNNERELSRYNVAVSTLGVENDFVLNIINETNRVEKISFVETVIADKRSGISHTYYAHDDDFDDFQYTTGMGRAGYRRFFALVDSSIRKYNCKVSLDFIIANRLQKTYYSQASRNAIAHGNYEPDRLRNRDAERIDYLRLANDEMTTNIKNWLDEYNELSSIAKNKLPTMYIKAKNPVDMTFEQFEKRWNNYHQELNKFFELGILERSEALIKAEELEDAFREKTSFLVTYLDAYEGTLAPLQANYDKLKLLSDIFDKRNEITQKTIKFTKNGIEIYAGTKKIDIDCLSSGEKNDFIMFYWLIFNTNKHGVVLIDEPEISLHIEWQEEYLDRLIEICQMNNLQAIVATHSPNIIGNHIDLFVDKR